MLLVHSKSGTPAEIESFIEAWDGDLPIVIVPTAYPDLSAKRIVELGKVKMVIYGNHAIRATISAMQKVFSVIIEERGIKAADREIVPVTEVFRLQDMDKVKRLENSFLR
jgi:2-methylisocitrate lyase-like PEP mutase family enzyme